jgi:hypothetical protein
VFSRTHIPARRKTFGFAFLGGQERRQTFTLNGSFAVVGKMVSNEYR